MEANGSPMYNCQDHLMLCSSISIKGAQVSQCIQRNSTLHHLSNYYPTHDAAGGAAGALCGVGGKNSGI